MNRANVLASWTNLLALAAALLWGVAYAQSPEPLADTDPPVRVGRLSYASGQVSFSPAGNDEWAQAVINRPIVTGDRLWADSDSRGEISIDNSTWWLGDRTSVTVANLDDRIAQVQVHEGVLDVRVRRLPAGDIVEIDTPNLAFSVTRAGRYRIEVDPQDGSTMVVVRDGAGEVYGESASYVITAGQAYRFYGNDISDSEFVALPPTDAFDRFALDRDRRYSNVASVRYVSPEVVGYEDLDRYGSWSAESTYGNVWFPRSVHAGWSPYSEGHWTWIDPWGWTWVDDEPWGFAPFHYGRWAHFGRGWGWVPGPRRVRPVYAPALVAFVGGAGFSLSLSSGPAIGWFPLAPRDVYVPAYHVSRNYFRQVNVSNTVINVTNITNIYNNPARVSQLTYANQRAPNAVTAVPPAAFAQARDVQRAAIQLPAAVIQRAQVHPMAPVAPAQPALLGAAPAARAKPPAAALQRAVIAKVPPPPPPIPDAQKLQALEKNPGRPLDRAQVQTLRRALPPAAVAAPAVKVVEQPKPAINATPPARSAGPGARPPGRAALPSAGTPPGQAERAVPAPGAPSAVRPPEVGGRANRPAQAQERPQGATTQPLAPAQPPGTGSRDARPGVGGPPEGPAGRALPREERAAPSAPVARPPGRLEGAPPGQAIRPPPGARPVTPAPAEPAAAERAAQPAPPEVRPQPQPRARESGPQPQRPPEARPAPRQPGPETHVAPPRPPEARPQPRPAPETREAPPRPPEVRPQPRPAPETREAPQRQLEARPQPQRPPQAAPRPPGPPPQAAPRPPGPPPQAAPRPPTPPHVAPGPPEARGGPPRPPPKKEDKGKDNDRKEPNG